ncbi:L-type lectin-domain containing receptor kinase S.5 [Spatholobus suberectus]|nr:L-type lectin-domain containing receptor kinase S.5 [Spatholobus suberectus]
MLDSDYNDKLGDFGLTRTIQQRNETHHSTKEIAGTPGYMAPETFLTVETDVYAFGVLVLEVVCGRRPGNVYSQDDYKNSIVYWVWELYGKGKIVEVPKERLVIMWPAMPPSFKEAEDSSLIQGTLTPFTGR